MKFVSEDILKYCCQNSYEDSSLLKELIEYTHSTEDVPQMISGSHVGNFLQVLIKISQAKKVLEIGMFTGYSALKMAEVLPNDGMIHTCELMDRHIKQHHHFLTNLAIAIK